MFGTAARSWPTGTWTARRSRFRYGRPPLKILENGEVHYIEEEPLKKKDHELFEKKLLEERAKLVREIQHLDETVLNRSQRDSSGDLSAYSFHMADMGTDSMEREKAFLAASAEGRQLLEIDEALRRLYRGEYGLCQICGEEIAKKRLEAVPHATLCLVCKQKEEKAGRWS
jgi:RNA polymerase-binding protein DksA